MAHILIWFETGICEEWRHAFTFLFHYTNRKAYFLLFSASSVKAFFENYLFILHFLVFWLFEYCFFYIILFLIFPLLNKSGLGKNPGNSKKPMGMGKNGFYREKWEKREKLSFFQNTCLKSMLNHWQIMINVLMVKIKRQNKTHELFSAHLT